MAASPAERFAAARHRARSPVLSEFAAGYPFPLDGFQLRACAALEAGRGVLVAAPTGAGKTVVGEFAAHLALGSHGKCFYTTPIKALSNQKYADLSSRYGAETVGLLTGDTARNGDAPLVVMTTEVLRNMLYADSSALRGLSHVVMDEVHYLSDRFRGAVWEEVIVHLPEHVALASLSATVSNAEEFGDWLTSVRGATEVIVEEHRPVPLSQHMLVDGELMDLFSVAGAAGGGSDEVNPALVRRVRERERSEASWERPGRRRPGPAPRRRSRRGPDRVDVVTQLDRSGLLPAITFVFSRAGCDAAVAACQRAGLRLTTAEERDRIHAYAEVRTARLAEGDLDTLGFFDWMDALERGVAAHHAGLLPVFKEVTEELFIAGLVRAVFATETLALGVNMPARSVVLERLTKFNGQTHADITAGEYTQLTGRAGRRGIDVEGHAVVIWGPGADPVRIAGLASTRTYPLRSSFRPSYNMTVNLLRTVGSSAARTLLDRSFAQFQADRAVAGLRRQATRARGEASREAALLQCHLGDLPSYLALRDELSNAERGLAKTAAASRRAAVASVLATLRPGDVVALPGGRHRGVAVVVSSRSVPGAETAVAVVTAGRALRRLTVAELSSPPRPIGRIRLPRSFTPRSPTARRDVIATLRAQGLLEAPPAASARSSAAEPEARVAGLRDRLGGHPCHRCPDREIHLGHARRHSRLLHDVAALDERVTSRAGSLARTFDRIRALLTERGYLDGEQVTPAGEALARVYAEADLVVVESLRCGVWETLDPAGLAAVVSSLVFEGRHPDEEAPNAPDAVRTGLAATLRIWTQLREAEAAHRLDTLRAPDPGFAWAVHRWAAGASLGEVLGGSTLAAGDFVRWCKQVIDLLDQISGLPPLLIDGEPSTVPPTARAAVAALRRGVVADLPS